MVPLHGLTGLEVSMCFHGPERTLLAHPDFCSIVNNRWLWKEKLKGYCLFEFVNVSFALEEESIHVMVVEKGGEIVARFIGMITAAEFFKDSFNVFSIGMTSNVVTEDFLYSKIEDPIKFMAIFFKQGL